MGTCIKMYPGGENLTIEEEEKEAADIETIAEKLELKSYLF